MRVCVCVIATGGRVALCVCVCLLVRVRITPGALCVRAHQIHDKPSVTVSNGSQTHPSELVVCAFFFCGSVIAPSLGSQLSPLLPEPAERDTYGRKLAEKVLLGGGSLSADLWQTQRAHAAWQRWI